MPRRQAAPHLSEAVAPSGARYNLKLYAFWDDGPPILRAWVDADDGSARAFMRPVATTFIIAPDGSFVDE